MISWRRFWQSKGMLISARRFAALEEVTMPDRVGVASAVVAAALGKKEEASAALNILALDSSRPGVNPSAAVDALIRLEAPTARAAAEKLLTTVKSQMTTIWRCIRFRA